MFLHNLFNLISDVQTFRHLEYNIMDATGNTVLISAVPD